MCRIVSFFMLSSLMGLAATLTSQASTVGMTTVGMMGCCGAGMVVMMWVAGLLGLGLLASLIVLVWVLIKRLRQGERR